MEDGYPILGIVVVLLLLVLKAIISYGARAIEHINEVTVRKRAEDGDDKSKVLLGFIEKPDKYMNAVEVILTTSSVLVGYICAGDIAYTFRDIGFPEQFGLPVEITKEAWTVAFVFLVLFISILFGDVFPKKLALKDSNKAAYGIANVVLFFIRLVTPIAFLIEKTTNLILRLCHIKPEDLEENVTEDEIMSMVNEGQEQGVLASNEAEMISNIIEFDEKEVKDIMTHRKKIVAIDCNLTVEQTLRFMLEKSYSRFPLFEDDINNIIGILHVKDVTRCYMSSKFKNKPLKLIARKPYFVPDTQNIDVLFNDMQLKKIHMAIAVDEYGQTAGLVAMEDILEEIVGNILDEYDEDEKLIIKQGEGRYLMKGLASLDDIEDTLGIEIEEEDFDTLNGLLTSLLNRIPSEGEHISVSYAGYLFEILDVKYKMIRFVRVTKELEDEPIELGELELE
ncbi:putative hemolysin [Anaerosporobacter mobilis DSM 15930]|jgi:putative hemolysin|uniref:Putative hemolysin n=1 Tax=Anaerosporobacter mobilis DSM 15930 TaxID=1120996 RepID=A0A1M7N0E9_9FIRM|nr:hemolysin family protein [Anaerosporobacter mobilis]SHM96990.1 putative hemolysin [Anaerosporobacter mobilis DSM 15930]